MQPTHWIHDINPFLVPAWGWFPGIRWYGLAYLAGILCGLWLVARWSKRGETPLKPLQVQDFAVSVALGMIIGGRLGFCIFYEPALFTEFGGGFPWWGVLAVNNGGMASHGGLVGLVAGVWWYAHKQRLSLGVLADLVAVTAPIGIFFGRLANFINGELWGRVSDVSWAVIFPDARPHPKALHGRAAWDWQVANGYENLPRHPSQLYAAGLEGLMVLAVTWWVHRRHRSPGLSTATALIAYGVARFIDEFWRMPDAGQPGGPPLGDQDPIPPILGFMSKGQALTIPVLIIGIILAIWAWRRGARPDAYRAPAEPQPAL